MNKSQLINSHHLKCHLHTATQRKHGNRIPLAARMRVFESSQRVKERSKVNTKHVQISTNLSTRMNIN